MANTPAGGALSTDKRTASNQQKLRLDRTKQVAQAEGIDWRTLWGVYGTESSFGANTATSSAGAEGPFQFLPSTGVHFGLNQATIEQFDPSLIAAARYLKSLGADKSVTSAATAKALNAYSGGGGQTYINSVISKGSQIAGLTGGDAGSDIGGKVQGGALDVLPGGETIKSAADFLSQVFNFLVNPASWLRILEVVGGLGLAAFALTQFARAGRGAA